nr:uncharacterized protein LOC109730085 isoform X1 [Microcebus murinus]
MMSNLTSTVLLLTLGGFPFVLFSDGIIKTDHFGIWPLCGGGGGRPSPEAGHHCPLVAAGGSFRRAGRSRLQQGRPRWSPWVTQDIHGAHTERPCLDQTSPPRSSETRQWRQSLDWQMKASRVRIWTGLKELFNRDVHKWSERPSAGSSSRRLWESQIGEGGGEGRMAGVLEPYPPPPQGADGSGGTQRPGTRCPAGYQEGRATSCSLPPRCLSRRDRGSEPMGKVNLCPQVVCLELPGRGPRGWSPAHTREACSLASWVGVLVSGGGAGEGEMVEGPGFGGHAPTCSQSWRTEHTFSKKAVGW